MTVHSPKRQSVRVLKGLKLIHRGKVRDTYQLTDELLLSVATNAISIFDFVLNWLIPGKGIILNLMNHFWSMYLGRFGIKTHLVAAGADIDQYLPKPLRNDWDLQARAIVIRKLKMAPVEFVARGVITGGGYNEYKKHGHVCGHILPQGLQDGDALPEILATPTTKAQTGHDESLPADQVKQKYPHQTKLLLEIFGHASSYLETRGVKLVDTKLEFGECGTLGDEIITPDSSRFWSLETWKESRKLVERKACPPMDKEMVRNYGKEHGMDKLKDPEDPAQIEKAHALQLPEFLIKQTSQMYRYIFWRQTGLNCDYYLARCLGVNFPRSLKNIVVLCGSPSDLDVVTPVVKSINPDVLGARIVGHVISCHRNPDDLDEFVRTKCDGVDAIVCAGGKAFALPGVLDARLHAAGKDIPVVGVALGEPGSQSLKAAQLSIEELPGQPVIMDEINGGCYSGAGGLEQALWRLAIGELPPAKTRVEKPAKMEVFTNY